MGTEDSNYHRSHWYRCTYTHTFIYLTLCPHFHIHPLKKPVFKNKQDSFANPRLQSLNNDCRKLPEISRKTLSIKIVGIHFSEEEWVCCHSNLSKSLENWLEGSPQSPGRASFTFCIVEGLKGFSWRFCNLDFRVMYPANKTHVWQPMCLYSCLCSLLVFLDKRVFPSCTSSMLFLVYWSLSCHMNTHRQFIFHLTSGTQEFWQPVAWGFTRPPEPTAPI